MSTKTLTDRELSAQGTRYQVQRRESDSWTPVRTNDEAEDGCHGSMSGAYVALNDIRRVCLNCGESPPEMRVEVVNNTDKGGRHEG